MKAIKIVETNREKIEQALSAVNGRAIAFTTTDYSTVATIADASMNDIASAAGAKKHVVGCKVIRCKAYGVAKRYKYSRIATEITIEYRKTGAYLINARRVELWPDNNNYRTIILTDSAKQAIERKAVKDLSW